MATLDTRGTREQTRGEPEWFHVLMVGFVLWLAAVWVTAATDNVNLIPTVVLLGSFLVPVSGVLWYLDHDRSEVLTPRLVARAFVVGGVLGVLMASLLESWLLHDGVLLYFGVGLIEEGVKLVALLYVARGLTRHTVRDGIVLGATVGFGFAALESSGYALSALVVMRGGHVSLSLGSLVQTELLRGVLAPVGHGLWTGILGGVLFGQGRGGRLRPTGAVVGAYLLVAALHGLWDSMRGIAITLTGLLTATHAQRIALTYGKLLEPTPRQIHLFVAIDNGGLVAVSVVGLLVLRHHWRGAGGPELTWRSHQVQAHTEGDTLSQER